MEPRSKFTLKRHNLPSQLTSFVGRTNELADLTGLLADPACRLLTLVGPGGVGKTRLAIQAAAEMVDHTAHGVYFVPLQPVQSADFLISAVADAINVPLSGPEEPEIQLLNYLRDKEMLLVLDNFEQLLTPPEPMEARSELKTEVTCGTGFLTDILTEAGGVKLLVTSREVLNLQEEWLYPVEGLAFPPPGTELRRERDERSPDNGLPAIDEQLAAYDAVKLFVERAGRVRRDFSLVEEQAGLARICQLVEGVPLAIELAASWTKTLSCRTITAEIQRSLDFLATDLRNVPDRHRNMQAIFDYSWQRLTDQERNVFKRLAVFRGGFRRAAAEQVAGASLRVLSALVDKSLLRWDPRGRYQIHELLRQYAAEKLGQAPEDVTNINELHCAYYADFLQQLKADIEGGKQPEAIQEIATELDNIRAAWQWAVQQVSIENIQKAAYCFYHFFDFQGRYQEGADALAKAIDKLDNIEADSPQRLTLASLLVLQGYHYIRLGRIEAAKTVLNRGQALYRDLNESPPPGFGTDPVAALGLVANILGNFEEAAELGEQARQRNQVQNDKQNLQIALYVLTDAAFAQGRYEVARNYAQQAYAVTQETNNRWMMAYILTQLGNVARALEDYAQAQQHYQASYAMKQVFNDPEGMAAALNQMAKIAWLQQAYQEAEEWFQQSRAIYREINDRGGLVTSLQGLGDTTLAMGDPQTASRYFCQALQIATDINWVPVMLSILISIGELMHQTGQPERGIELQTLVLHHPSSDHQTKTRAKQRLAHYQTELPANLFTTATQRGQESDLETIITTVQAELAVPGVGPKESQIPLLDTRRETTGVSEEELPASPYPTSPELVEQLTPRELEVLQLIANGLTNQQIADELIISVGTVKSYTSQIYGKLNVNSRTQAVARARALKLLP